MEPKLLRKAVGCNSGEREARLYNISILNYNQQHSVVVEKLCNGITVINKGTTIVMWNGLPLMPGPTDNPGVGESLSVGGNEDEVFVGRVDLSFEVPTPAPLTITNSVWVIQKFYVDKTFI